MTDEIAHPKLMPVASMANISQGGSSTGPLAICLSRSPEGRDRVSAAIFDEDGRTSPYSGSVSTRCRMAYATQVPRQPNRSRKNALKGQQTVLAKPPKSVRVVIAGRAFWP